MAAIATISAGLLVFASPALATVPPNDTSATAKVIDAVPFRDAIDTTEATTDAEEQALAAACWGVPALPPDVTASHGVWYKLTATEDGYLSFDVRYADYIPILLLASGAPGSLTFLDCSALPLAYRVKAGTTYYVLVSGIGRAPQDQYGEVTVRVMPPAADLGVAVTPDGGIGKTRATFVIDLTNRGPDLAIGLVVTMTATGGLTDLHVLDPVFACETTTTAITCHLPELLLGGMFMEVVGTIPTAAPVGTLFTLTASVRSDLPDPVLTDNTDTGTISKQTGTLPATGTSSGTVTATGFLLLVLGIALVAAARRLPPC